MVVYYEINFFYLRVEFFLLPRGIFYKGKAVSNIPYKQKSLRSKVETFNIQL